MDTGSGRVEKRNRPPVSCEPCRTRKLKCNRGLPCDACTRRGLVSHCNYAANAIRNKPGPPKPPDLKDRLNSLENMVSSFLSGDASQIIMPPAEPDNGLVRHGTASSGTSGEDALTPETPHLQETADGQVNYIDPSHWLSILDDIKEVKEHLSVSSWPVSQNEIDSGVNRGASDGFLLGSTPDLSLDGLLSSLPSQPICDMLLSWYFNSRFMVLAIIHPVKFQDEYAKFWESPSTTPPLWTALLFSVLSLAASLRQISGLAGPAESTALIRTLQQRTLQCLSLGQFTTANAHALEAYILHLQSCFISNNGAPIDPWFDMGTIIRLSFRMGYHRDPSNLAGISPFDSEMRRRVWLNIFQVDALLSFQLGFPSMIPTDFCDTEVPRNLQWSDLDTNMAVLPPSRPLSEDTPVAYTIVKAGVMSVFKKIAAHTQAPTIPSYGKTLELDAEMKQAYSAVPERLKRRDVNRSFIDHPCLIWERCSIELLYLKGIIILHRRYVSYELQSPRFEASRRGCVEAALNILSRQADLHTACEPGGRLYEDRWMFASLQPHDFLLAAMVVCLDLSVRMRSLSGALTLTTDYRDLSSREYRALEASQRVWAASSAVVPEAHTAAMVLDLMVKKAAENSAGLLLVSDISSGSADSGFGSELPLAGAMSQMIDGSEGIDWGLLDQYLQGIDSPVPDATA